ncbi:histidine kinase, partial [Acinetobacter baumannii]
QGEIAKWQAEAAARELELQVLRAQINPHFLFNALNNLRALINEDPARAREMLSRLSNTLRHTLQHSAKERVPLADELAVVRDYIALEQLHHE